MSRPRATRRGGALAALSAGVLAALLPSTATAADSGTATHALAPYLKAYATDADKAVDLGVEYLPSSGYGLGLRLALSVAKPDPTLPPAELSTRKTDLGARLQLSLESATTTPTASAPGYARVGTRLDLRWGIAEYSWNPPGAAEQSDHLSSWKLEWGLWWWGSSGGRYGGAAPPPEEVTGHAPAAGTFSAVFFQPQFLVSYARTPREADDTLVVEPAPPSGPQTASAAKLTGPTQAATLSAVLAVPVLLRDSRFGIGPAVRFTSRGSGAGSSWDPTGQVSRLRMEAWGYYFAFEESEAIRIGVAPFVDIRTSGRDRDDGLVAGAVVELRTSTRRLDY